MKKYFLFGLAGFLLTGLSIISYSQDDTGTDMETYVKTNIAVTKFRVLGVTQKQYAKCLETENYLEPEKKMRFVIIDKTSFSDDGQGYDLVAGDGILTSNQLFQYTGTMYLPGTYHEIEAYNAIIADDLFAYHSRINVAEKFKFGCKLKWVRCSEMTFPDSMLCRAMGWPYGGFRLVECEFGWEW